MEAGAELKRSKKRPRETGAVVGDEVPTKLHAKGSEKPVKQPNKFKPGKPSAVVVKKKTPETARERRIAAKEMAEERKKKRKPHYNLEKELALLWEKMRRSNVSKEEKSKLISEALRKMSGKILEIASSHVSARVLQTCVKYCSQEERDIVYEELRPHLLALARQKYAVHLVNKLLDTATKKQLEAFISSLHGQVSSLLRHSTGSVVVEHVYQLGNASQKQCLLLEMYSTELQLFKDLTRANAGRLVDVISKLGLQKSAVLQHMNSTIQTLLEKGIVEHSIIHSALIEYFTIADRTSAADVIQQLTPLLIQDSSMTDDGQQLSTTSLGKNRKKKMKKLRVPLLVRMAHMRDGLKLGILCIKHGTAKDRKKIVKAMKGHINKLALNHYGSLLLICILSVVDDTKLVTKIIIRELQTIVKELVLDRNGARPLLDLLHPQCARYLSPGDVACLGLSVASLCSQSEETDAVPDKTKGDLDTNMEVISADTVENEPHAKSTQLAVGGKKDPSLRRYELLVESGLADTLIETCIENAGELLRFNFGREVIYEVAIGGRDGILKSDRLAVLHEAIASFAALPKTNESEGEHAFENFHSSRTIRKLILDCPTFAATLWRMALEGKCESWAQGHSCKVVSAFMESSDSNVRDLAKAELQPLIDRGVLKVPDNRKI